MPENVQLSLPANGLYSRLSCYGELVERATGYQLSADIYAAWTERGEFTAEMQEIINLITLLCPLTRAGVKVLMQKIRADSDICADPMQPGKVINRALAEAYRVMTRLLEAGYARGGKADTPNRWRAFRSNRVVAVVLKEDDLCKAAEDLDVYFARFPAAWTREQRFDHEGCVRSILISFCTALDRAIFRAAEFWREFTRRNWMQGIQIPDSNEEGVVLGAIRVLDEAAAEGYGAIAFLDSFGDNPLMIIRKDGKYLFSEKSGKWNEEGAMSRRTLLVNLFLEMGPQNWERPVWQCIVFNLATMNGLALAGRPRLPDTQLIVEVPQQNASQVFTTQ